MARRISGGTAGSAGLGGIQVSSTTLTAADNADITIDPSGTGIVKIAGDAQLQAQGDLRFADSDSSNWVAFQAPATIATNVTWTLPATDGSSNQVLTTNASGTLSWSTAAVTISTETASSSTYYIPITTTTTGTITSANVNNDATVGLSYIPSSGTLSAGAAIFKGTVNALRTENVKTTSYTFALVDRDKVVAFNGTSSQTLTVPANSAVAFPIGSVLYANRLNTGGVTLAASGGVTINKTGTLAQYEEIFLRKRDTDAWIVVDTPKNLSATGGAISSSSGYTIHSYTSGSSTFVI